MRRAILRVLVVALGGVFALALAGAAAAQAPEDARETARRLLAEGAALYEAGRHVEALGKFEAAFRAVPSPRIRYNLALALREIGRDGEAAENFRAFLRDAPDAPPEARKEAEAAMAELERQLGRLEVLSEEPGAEVVVSGRAVGTTPLSAPVFVSPGSVEVLVNKAGFERYRQVVVVRRGEAARLSVRLTPAAPPPFATLPPAAPTPVPAPPPPVATVPTGPYPPTTRTGQSWPPPGPGPAPPPYPAPAPPPTLVEKPAPARRGVHPFTWVAGGIGLAGLGSGVAFGLLTQSTFSEVKERYDEDKESAGKTYNTLQIVGYSVGALGLGTALLVGLLSGGDEAPVAVIPAPGGAGVGWTF